MRRVYVDIGDKGDSIEYCYKDKYGNTESVAVDLTDSRVTITDDSDEYLIYVDDIPKLIKALQAAYDYHRENS